jgi:hypothetical protein
VQNGASSNEQDSAGNQNSTKIDHDPSRTGADTSTSPNTDGLKPPENSITFPGQRSWEYVEEVVNMLKTAFPLLILSMETTVDQISHRFKATQEEEIYRLICMLLQDAMQVTSIVRAFVLKINCRFSTSTTPFVSIPWMMMVHFHKGPIQTSTVWSLIYLVRLE